MTEWAKTTDQVIDNGFGGSREGENVRGVIIHHAAGTDALSYVANENSRDSHPTYHIDRSGKVTGIVNPNKRPYSTANSVDKSSVTFEMDNESTGGDWPITDATLRALVDVIADHARQSGYSKAAINNPDARQAEFYVGFHKQYTSTACPGPYVERHIPYIVQQVNLQLAGKAPTPPPSTPSKPQAPNTTPAKGWAFNVPDTATQKRVQQALKNRGRYSGPVDGVWGINTVKGIQTTIKNVGYTGPVDGIPGPSTCHYVQVYAQKFGSYTGPIDSILGPNGWSGFALGLERP